MSKTTSAVVDDHSPSGFARMFGALAENKHYRTYWFGNQASTMMFQMQMVAQGYLAYTLTGSASSGWRKGCPSSASRQWPALSPTGIQNAPSLSSIRACSVSTRLSSDCWSALD